jgi:exosortase/archaeosortase family protein
MTNAIRLLLVAVLLVLLPTVASGDGWTINYIASSNAPGGGFFGAGAYDFLLRGDAVQVYRQQDGHWVYLGASNAVTLPAGFPNITFPPGIDQIVVVPGGSSGGGNGSGGVVSIGAPDPLGSFFRPPVKIERGLQLGSAMIATAILRTAGLEARRFDTSISLPRVTVHVWWQCAGVTTLLLLVGLAGLTRRYALVALALPLALLDNGLRIAIIGLVAEYGGVAMAHGWHDVIGYAVLAVPLTVMARLR